MNRSLIILPFTLLILTGQGCLADPPQVNRPIVLHYFDNNKPKLPLEASSTEAVGSSSGTGVVAPPVQAGEFASASGNVVVTSLVPNQVLPNPFVILGRGLAFEGVLNWRVVDGHGTEVAAGNVLTEAPDTGRFGSFRASSFYDRLPGTGAGRVDVFTRSPRDGSEQDMLSIPVKLTRETTPLKIFFINEQKDPGLLRCDKPYAVTRRVPKTVNVAEAALRELLKGPSAAEQLEGSVTAFVPGTSLKSVKIEGDTATADFSREFALGIAGSCNVLALRSQVEQTLKQFTGVKQVKILVEGANAEQYLQP